MDDSFLSSIGGGSGPAGCSGEGCHRFHVSNRHQKTFQLNPRQVHCATFLQAVSERITARPTSGVSGPHKFHVSTRILWSIQSQIQTQSNQIQAQYRILWGMVYLVSGPPRPLVSRHVDADTNGKGKGKRKGKERVMQKEMEQGKEKVNGNEIRDLKFNILLIGMLSGRR